MNRGWQLALAVAVVVLCSGPLFAVDIVVDGSCTLGDAILAANQDSPFGGCPAGLGPDTVLLTADVVLTAQLAEINQDLIVDGQGFTVSRDPGAPAFRIFSGDTSNLTYRNLTVTGGSDGTGFSQAGGIWDRGINLTLENTTITANEGNGIYTGSLATIDGSTISGNTGSGIYTSYALLEVTSSTISDNQEAGVTVGSYTDVTLTNSTISGNDVGVDQRDFYPYVYLVQSTIAANRVGIAVYPDFSYGVTMEGTVFGHNSQTNCASTFFADLGGNLADDISCGTGFSFLTGLDATLADNGGPTQTHALLGAASSAVNAAGACGLAVDQRRFTRNDGACDSGAFELGGTPIGTLGGFLGGGNGVGSVRCSNRTQTQTVTVPLDSTQVFDCDAAGLLFASGDTVRLNSRDTASGSGAVGGTAIGMTPTTVRCLNATTEQRVLINAPQVTWDCEAAGLSVVAGDFVQQLVVGTAD